MQHVDFDETLHICGITKNNLRVFFTNNCPHLGGGGGENTQNWGLEIYFP